MLSKNEDRIGCVLCVFAVFYLVLFLCTFIYFRSHVASVCLLVRPPVCTRMLYTFCVHFHSEGTCCVKCVCLTKEYRKFFVSCVRSALFFFCYSASDLDLTGMLSHIPGASLWWILCDWSQQQQQRDE